MGKIEDDEDYKRGVKAGKKGFALTDFTRSLGKGFPASRAEETFDKGYDFGAEHRHDSTSSSSDSGDKENDSGSGGGCYLTTACINARDLPDNCLELNVLRNFRDRILLQNSEGRKAVKEYYQIAPEIVQSINERSDSLEIWNSVYQDITKAVQLVLSGNFDGAFEHYKNMTLRLRNK